MENLFIFQYFTAAPPNVPNITNAASEVLVEIIGHLSHDDLLSVSYVSKHFRKTLLKNAGAICNRIIQQSNDLSNAAKFLEAKLVDGWLVPQHPKVCKHDHLFARQSHGRCPICSYYHRKASAVLLSSPGPQFLFYLQHYHKEIAEFEQAGLEEKKRVIAGLSAVAQEEARGVKLLRTLFRNAPFPKNVKEFIRLVNCGQGKNAGSWHRSKAIDYGLRDLAWYYKANGVKHETDEEVDSDIAQ